MAVQLHNKCVLGEFELEPDKYLLKHHNQYIHLPELPFQVLLYLVENRERYVSRQELLERFWNGGDSYEETLTKCISTIRTELNDPPTSPTYIETRKKVGYRYVGPFQEMVTSDAWVGMPAAEIEQTRGMRIVVEEDDEKDNTLVNEKVFPAQLRAQTPIKVLSAAPSQRAPWLVTSVLAWAVITMMGGAYFIYRYYTRSILSQPPSIHSLAVLPLENMSGDPAQDYFADGMTEALITEMAKIGAIRVISRTSAMQYKGVRKPLPEIARELHVDGIVEGAVIRSGGRVRITAQLINAATDQHVWAESYERDLSDVLSLQSEVARGIANQINVTLSRQEQTLLARKPPINPAANEAYFKGLYWFNQERNAETHDEGKPFFLKSIEFYEQAIKLQPDYASAYAGLARANHWMGPDFYPKAKETATKALQLDDTLAEAHGALAYTIFNGDWDWSGAEREFKRAIELNPSYAEAHHGYALYLSAAGRSAEAIAEIKRAEELDPLLIPIKENVVRIYFEAHQYDHAQAEARTILDLNPEDPSTHFLLGFIYNRKGMYPESFAELQKALDRGGKNPFIDSTIALTYAEAGKRELAIRQLDKVKKEFKPPQSPRGLPTAIAAVYSVLGEKDEAFKWLDRSYKARAANLLQIKSFPEFDSLRSDPRFEELLRRIGFPS
jgi:TolB-like protein/DNA-binding winged helix-turn-helix (wHTH) protein/Tfp pilus assembly protein PilF